MKAVILAGGIGIRLRPFTFSIPKPLLPIGEKPILEIIIGQLKKFGFCEFILAIGYKSKMVETYFRDGSDLGVSISYLVENEPSGTAGPLAQLRENFKIGKDESFLIMNGDILTKLDFSRMAAFHKNNKFDITVGTKVIDDRSSYGLVDVQAGLVKAVVEKPSTGRVINVGIYIVNSSAVMQVPGQTFFTMPDLINKLISQNRPVGAYDIKEYWVGLEDLTHFEDVYNNGEIRQMLASDL